MTDPNVSHVPITEWAALVPELDVRDLTRSLDVYTRPGFAYLSLGRIQWMLSQIREGGSWQTGALEYPLGRGINFQISVPDVEALYRRLEAKAYPIFVPMKTSVYLEGGTEHQQREFLVLDPDGYLLRFTD